jgi:uncharacterized DUF497 family protein
MDFEWDEQKAAQNRKKHGVGFHEAATVFGDPMAISFPDPDHSTDEERYITIGTSGKIGCSSLPIRIAATVCESSAHAR